MGRKVILDAKGERGKRKEEGKREGKGKEK